MWADSLAKQEVTSQMAEVKVKYETQEKELEITRLREKVLKQEADSLKIALALIAGLACLVIILLQQRHKRRNAERELLRMRQEKNWNRHEATSKDWKKNAGISPKSFTTVPPTTCLPSK